MNKYGIKKLKNGLKIIYCITPKKNIKFASINISFGGAITKIKTKDKVIDIKRGSAHLLEHFIIEDTIYGNYVTYMSEQNASFNGVTSALNTSFYFSCVDKFEDHLCELLNIVNKPNFKNIEDVKGPIIEEIKESLHNNYREFDDVHSEQLMGYNYSNILGSIEDITNYKVDELKSIYDLCYKPENQVLVLKGNFNIKKMVKLIESKYEEYNKVNYKYKEADKFKDSISIPRKVVGLNRADNIVEITFKMRKDIFTDDELKKLSYYFGYISEEAFSDTSKAFRTIIEKGYSNYSISRRMTTFKDYLFLSLAVYTEYEKEVLDLLFDTIKTFDVNDTTFELWKKNLILNYFIDHTNPSHILNELIDNYKNYKTIEVNDIDFYESCNKEELMNIVKKMDFTNYVITVGERNENN